MAKRNAQIEVSLKDRASAGLKRLGGVASGLARSFGLVTAAATAISTVVGARFLSGAISSAAEFSEAMSAVRAVTGASAEEFNALRDAADEAGATTRFTATEAAQGLEELARGGQNATEAIESLNPVLALATANNQTVAESAQQVITTLNQFGLAAGESGRVADVFTAAAQRSAQTTAQLARAFQQAGPVAAQANLTIEQTSAIIGRLADAGFRGERGGTALRNALTQLSDPASKFSRELDALGIEGGNFVEVLAQLEARGDDANQAIRALGLESAPAIQALVSSGSTGLNALVGELNEAAGAADRAAAVMENNLPGALRSLRSAYDSARRALVEPLTGRLTEEIQGITDRIREFVQSGRVERFARLLKEGFDTALQAVKEFIAGIDFDEVTARIEAFVENAQIKLGEFGDASDGLRQAFTRITGAVQVFVGSIRGLFNGLGVAISGATSLATTALQKLVGFLNTTSFGQVEALKNLEGELGLFAESFSDTTAEFQRSLGDALGQVENGYTNLTKTFVEGGSDIQGTLDGIGSGIDENISDPSERAQESLRGVTEEAQSLASAAEELGAKAGEAAGEIEGLGISFETVTGDFGNGIERRTIPQIQSIGNAAEEAGQKLEESIGEASDDFDRTSEAAGRTARSVEQTTVTTERAVSSASGLANAIGGVLDSLRSISDGAAESVEEWVRQLPKLQTVEGFFSRLSKFSRELTEEFERQTEAADEAISAYQRSGDAAAGLGRAVNLLNAEYNLLDDQRLSGLRAVIARAKSESEGYLDSIISRNRQLQEEIARVRGEEEELSRLRDEERRKSIQDQIREAQVRSDFDAIDALKEQLRLEDQLAEEQLRQAQQSQQNALLESDRADQLERAADAAERESRAKAETRDEARRIIVDITAKVEQGEITFSEAFIARLTQRIIAQIELDQGRT